MECVICLLIDICGGEVGLVIDIINEVMLSKCVIIILCRSKLDCLIGYYIVDEQVIDILCRFGCEVIEGKDEWQVVVSSWCFDMEIEEDLVEEVVCVYGYNNILDELVQVSLIMGIYCEVDLSFKCVKMLFNDKGYQEVIIYSFVDLKVQQMIYLGVEVLLLLSSIFVEMSVMCFFLWIGLLVIVVYNQNCQQNCVCIFESGLCFVLDIQVLLGICQDLMLVGVICGNCYEEYWNLVKEIVDFYDLKGDFEFVFDLIGKLNEVEFCVEVNLVLYLG